MIAKTLTIALAATLAVASASAARAEDEAKPYAGRAPYVSLGGVYGIENNTSALGTGGVFGPNGLPTSGYGSLSDSGGYDIRGGYNIADMWALEIQWQSLLSFSTNAVDSITLNNMPAVEARMLSFNGRFSPLTGRIQPYLLTGMGWVNVQADRTGNSIHLSSFGMRFGAGVAAYLTERTGIALEAAYILPMSGVAGHGERFDIIPITASVFFRFK